MCAIPAGYGTHTIAAKLFNYQVIYYLYGPRTKTLQLILIHYID